MARKRDKGGDELNVDMTPMIDIVFLLIIFFMCVTKMDDAKIAADVKLPLSDNAIKEEAIPGLMVINLGKNPEVPSAQGISNKKGPIIEVNINGSIYLVDPDMSKDKNRYSRGTLQYHLNIYTKEFESQGQDVGANAVVKLRIDARTHFEHVKVLQDAISKLGIKKITYSAWSREE